MKKLFILYIAFLCFNISKQFQCEEFSYSSTCGYFNTNYEQKCNNLGSNTCYEIEIENGCKIEGNKCVNVNQNDKCVSYDYSLDNSGSVKVCKKVVIDEGCEVDSSNNCKSSATTASCEFNSYKDLCYNKNSICRNRNINSCTVSNDNCYKITDYSYCKTVEVDEECTINNGNCKIKNEENNKYNKCSFNSDDSRCEYKERSCEEIDSTNDCSKCAIKTPEKTCSKVKENNSLKCKDINIDTSHCEIKDGNCALKGGEQNNKACHYDNPYHISKCQYYEQDNDCLIDENTGECGNKPDSDAKLKNEKKKCKFTDEAQTKCTVVNYECSDYSEDTCEAATFQNEPKKKCSWSTYCQEYEIESPCTVNGGECKKKDGDNTNLGTNMECRFDNAEEKKCLPKNIKECKTYYKYDDCYSNTITVDKNKQCIYTGNNNCKEITIDESCKVDKDRNSQCKEISSDKLKSTEICAFDDDTEKNKCEKVDKKCRQITDKTDCNSNSKNKCSYHASNICYDADEYCTCEADSDGNLKPKQGKELKATEKCILGQDENYNYICKKVDKSCSDFTDGTNDKCETIAKTSEKQCYKFKGDQNCRTVELDGNCKVIRENNEDKCVEDGSGKLADNEKCAFESGKTVCKKREKFCSELSANECNNFALSNKQCYILSDYGKCKEVKVDSQCKIDEDKNCVNKGCSFNEDEDKCFYKNNGDSLKLKRLLLLLTLIML